MFLLTMLACTLGYDYGVREATISFEQTKAAHYYYYDKAIQSSVKIISYTSEEEIGHASANYFKIGQHKFIVTAAHVLGDGESLYAEDGNNKVRLFPAILDEENDLLFLIPEKNLKSIKAINYVVNKELDILGKTVLYAGYPADLEKSVFHGTIATYGTFSFMMQSFALPGASGAVVFDNKGCPIGVLSAIKMGMYGISPYPQLHGTLVFVNRLRQYDKYTVEELLVKWKSLRNADRGYGKIRDHFKGHNKWHFDN